MIQFHVAPAKAGAHASQQEGFLLLSNDYHCATRQAWIPAFAGMTRGVS